MLRGQGFLTRSLERLDEMEDLQAEELNDYQFSIITLSDWSEEDLASYLPFLRRIATDPKIYISEVSDNVFIQQFNGLSLEMKSRMIKFKKYKYTFSGPELLDWIIDNTNAETRLQATTVAHILLEKEIIYAIGNQKFAFHEKNSVYGMQVPLLKQVLFQADGEWGSDASFEKSQNSDNSGSGHDLSISKRVLLTVILEKSSLCKEFKTFLESIYCVENLSFYLKAKEYKQLFSGEDKCSDKKRAEALKQGIFDEYINNEDINIPGGMKAELEGNKELLKASIFDTVIAHVFHMMLTDSLQKFCKSDSYKKLQTVVFQEIVHYNEKLQSQSSIAE